jgi:hypothetical protein
MVIVNNKVGLFTRTDRILWSCDFGIIKQLFYNRREYKESDHRPVVAYFIVEVKKIDKQKKEEVLRKVYEVIRGSIYSKIVRRIPI